MAASKVPAGGLKTAATAAVDDAAAVKMAKGRWALAVPFFFVAFSVVALCVLLSSAPAPYAAIAGFFAPKLTTSTSTASASASQHADAAPGGGGAPRHVRLDNEVGSPCASMPDHGICCDRSDYHSDVCFMSGDVRTDAASLSLLLFPPPGAAAAASSTATAEPERIRPYTRKWDGYITKTIHEVTLRAARPDEESSAAAGGRHRCDVTHDAPAFVVTAGGYSHNLFHVFNDGFLPLWLTSQHLRRRVVLAVLAYTPRWAAAYAEIVSSLSAHHHPAVVDLLTDTRTHCFPGAIVGTRYHGYLAVNSSRLRDNKTVVDFHQFLAGAYADSNPAPPPQEQRRRRRPRLGIVSRKGRRVIENQAAVADLASAIGFEVEVMETGTGAPQLAATYGAVSSYDALVGVHGADLTAFLFLRPGRGALAQVAPLGIALLSRNLFGVPAERMGLEYEQYDVVAGESSLSRRYPAGHVVVADPARARREQGAREWDLVEHVYLRGQNVSIDLGRFRGTLDRMHARWKERQRSQVA
ncbi:unnamed protein product [Urochloa humidicola]